MPNNTTNHLTVTGPLELVEKFNQDAHGKEILDFNKLFPCPQKLRDTTEQHPITKEMTENKKEFGYFSWYDWCNDNWGTKWGAYDVDGDKASKCSFYTAWSPPVSFFTKISESYPDLTFDLLSVDEGGFYIGRAVIKNGKVREKWLEKYENSDGENVFKGNVPDILSEEKLN